MYPNQGDPQGDPGSNPTYEEGFHPMRDRVPENKDRGGAKLRGGSVHTTSLNPPDVRTRHREKWYEGEKATLWEFFQYMTFVMKANKADITTLLTDIAAIGNMMIDEYKIVVDVPCETKPEDVALPKTDNADFD
jgi:hypothetical protein